MKNGAAWILGFLLLFVSCNNERKRPDISGIKINVKVERFDKDIFSSGLDSLPAQIQMLKLKYGEFFDIFNYRILQAGGGLEPGYPKLLKVKVQAL